MNRFLILSIFSCLACSTFSQDVKLWTEADRAYLVQNLKSTRDSLVSETRHLTRTQWNFKESPDRWSINQIVEHINIWELLLTHEVSRALLGGPQQELAKVSKPDSVYRTFILEEKPHVSVEYTKPFTYSVPMGLNEGKNNVALFIKMRNESIDFLSKTEEDLRLYFLKQGRPNIHQLYITLYGHSERHLRQVRKVKQHPNFPRK